MEASRRMTQEHVEGWAAHAMRPGAGRVRHWTRCHRSPRRMRRAPRARASHLCSSTFGCCRRRRRGSSRRARGECASERHPPARMARMPRVVQTEPWRHASSRDPHRAPSRERLPAPRRMPARPRRLGRGWRMLTFAKPPHPSRQVRPQHEVLDEAESQSHPRRCRTCHRETRRTPFSPPSVHFAAPDLRPVQIRQYHPAAACLRMLPPRSPEHLPACLVPPPSPREAARFPRRRPALATASFYSTVLRTARQPFRGREPPPVP
mmetsp:Transcript_2294/g.6181  ORF Transcript_2294/g.6181 Transcript_2294/m.6181 type:complete len:264 (-) Transcript_2294:397-1188(-)